MLPKYAGKIVNVRSLARTDAFFYVGRKCGQFPDSGFGNPFSHLPNARAAMHVESRDMAVEYYRRWLTGEFQLPTEGYDLPGVKESYAQLERSRQWILGPGLVIIHNKLLEGIPLACWCAPLNCHATILVDLAE